MNNRVKVIKKNIIINVLAGLGVLVLSPFIVNSDNLVYAYDISQNQISCVGSVSKVYATAAAMQLVEEGKLRLDAPVTEYLSEFKMADDRYKDITVAMLMDHTSGIMGTNRNNLSLYDDGDIGGFRGQLENMSTQRLKANPGEYAAYCNDGFDVLALIVERVSGMSYTDYIVENIAEKLGVGNTGTAANLFGKDNLAPLYSFGNNRSDFEYCTSLGAGGIYATASDMAKFGSGFFTGNNTILSDESKNYMAKRWFEVEENAEPLYDKEYMAKSASGWDYVTQKKYDDAGVKVLGKGGDINSQHAHLLVAPDENISIGVLSTGGSSMYNGLFAQALLDEVLAEYGKEIDDTVSFAPGIIEKVPDECKKYEGYYVFNTEACDIKIEDDELKVYSVTEPGKNPSIYLPCENNGFVKVDDNGNGSFEKEILYFEENEDGKTYIKCNSVVTMPNLGHCDSRNYCGQKIESNPVSEEAMKVWKQYDGMVAAIMNAKYSAQIYDTPFCKVKVLDEIPGYIVVETQMGSRVFKITDENVCEAFTTIPSDLSRDLIDGILESVTLQDGRKALCITTSDGSRQIMANDMPLFENNMKTVKLTSGEAAWYRIGDDITDATIKVERPKNSAVYVYNKYRDIVYSSHVENPVSEISLPQGGYIVFLGETGGEITIS